MRTYLVTAVVCTVSLISCTSRKDESFGALQERGQTAMGVNQYTSTHRFDTLADGARIELQRDANDPRDVATIRAHLKEVMAAFQRGDFATPAFVHAQEVPGTRVMAARRQHLTYRYGDLPQGGEIRITTDDSEALRALHEFVAFQRKDHKAGGSHH